MSEHQRVAEYIEGRSLPARDEYRVRCPAHNGGDRNLSIGYKSGKTLMCCHSHGCTFEQIAAVLPSFLWDKGSYIPRDMTTTKREPKPLTLARKLDSKTFEFAEDMWVNAGLDNRTDHAYAVKKHFQPNAHVRVHTMPRQHAMLRTGERVLVIKMVDENGCFTGVQLINESGDRAFAGSQGMLILSNELWTADSTFHVVEGYATGTAVPKLFSGPKHIPVVAFSDSGMDKVTPLLRQRVKQERGFKPHIIVHHEPEKIDLWDVAYDPLKRARYYELRGAAA